MRVKKGKDVKQRNDSLQTMLTEGKVVSPALVEEYAVKEPSEVAELFQVPSSQGSEKTLSSQVSSSTDYATDSSYSPVAESTRELVVMPFRQTIGMTLVLEQESKYLLKRESLFLNGIGAVLIM